MESMISRDAKDDRKKARVAFSPKQLCMLEECFAANHFPKAAERKEIASKLNVTPHSIQIWFQNKRAKGRRKEQKMKEVQKKRFVPKPPPFWPENLPFDSNITDVMKSDEDHSTSISEPLHMDNQQPSTVPDNHGNNQPSSSQQLQLRTDCRTVALHHLEHESTDSYTFQALQPQHTSHQFCWTPAQTRAYSTHSKPDVAMECGLDVPLGHARTQSEHSAQHATSRPETGCTNAYSNTGPSLANAGADVANARSYLLNTVTNAGSGLANSGPGLANFGPGCANIGLGYAIAGLGLADAGMGHADAGLGHADVGLGQVGLGHADTHADAGLGHFNAESGNDDAMSIHVQHNIDISGLGRELGHTNDGSGHAHFSDELGHPHDDLGVASVHGHLERDIAVPYIMGDASQDHVVAPLILPTCLPNGHLTDQHLLMSPAMSPDSPKHTPVTPQGDAGVPKGDGLSHYHDYGTYYHHLQ